MNSGLVETVNDLLVKYNLKNFDAFLTFSVHYPFLKNLYIDNAIKSMYLFETDSVISVRKVDDTIFRSTEDGIKPFVDVENFSKLEREDLYKYSGGMIATKINHFLKESNFFGGKNGHVIIDEASSKELNSINDIKKINAI